MRQVGALRINSLGIMRKHKLEGLFAQFNEGLGNWKRAQLAEMADEIMFLVGFAGIGGTSSATASVGRFLGVQQSIEGGKDGVDFGGKSAADMRALYTANPQAFIMVCVPRHMSLIRIRQRSRRTVRRRARAPCVPE